MLKQTASKQDIKRAKKRAGKGKHSLRMKSFSELAKIAHIYQR